MSLRDSPFSDVKVPLAWTAALALVVMLVAGVALLVSDRRDDFETQAYGAAKTTLDTGASKVSGMLSAPIRWTESGVGGVKGYFFAVSENRKLRRENIELRRWRDAALSLQDDNDRLRTVLQLKTDPPVPMVTGRAVSDSRGPFSNSRLINVGRERGVITGNPVMSENGLVGRVVGVSDGAARVLMVTDIASKVPIMIDRTNARAIMTGDGGPNPKLAYLRGQNPVKQGDRIVTSGDGGVFPRGLPVGVAIKGLDGTWRVQLASDYAPIDYVRVLVIQDFSHLVSQQDLAKIQLPPAPADLLQPTGPELKMVPPATNAVVPAAGIAKPPQATNAIAPKVAPAVNAPAPKAAAPALKGQATNAPAARAASPPPRTTATNAPATRPATATNAPATRTVAPAGPPVAPKAAAPVPAPRTVNAPASGQARPNP